MPIYEYCCADCNLKFERLQRMGADGATCPRCNKPAKKALSAFACVSREASGETRSVAGSSCSGCASSSCSTCGS